MIGIGLAEFRNVVGDRAAVLGLKFSMAMVEEPQQRRPGAGPMAGLLESGRFSDIHDLSCRAMVACGGFYVASGGTETGPSAFIRGRLRCVAAMFAEFVRSGLENGDRLAFGNHVVEFYKNRFELAGRR